jgi:ketosteroid isomerase-like protein
MTGVASFGGLMTQGMLLAIALLVPGAPPDTFALQAELQGLYDEISQATLQFATASDVDQFHDVLYTPDWVFVDTPGQKRNWSQMREEAIQALSSPALTSMSQPIRKLSVTAEGATVMVDLTTVRTIVDHEGRYGRKEASHTLTNTTPFRDRWVRVSDNWKLKSRDQIGRPMESVDKPE